VSDVSENAVAGANMPIAQNADRKNALRRRRSKNSGGGIAPTAMAALIEGAFCSVNAFRHPRAPAGQPQNADKPLMRLNFRYAPGNGWRRVSAFPANWAPVRVQEKAPKQESSAVSVPVRSKRNGSKARQISRSRSRWI